LTVRQKHLAEKRSSRAGGRLVFIFLVAHMAMIEETVRFKNLGLAIIDEQQPFGGCSKVSVVGEV
jgi:RecG-like helicase